MNHEVVERQAAKRKAEDRYEDCGQSYDPNDFQSQQVGTPSSDGPIGGAGSPENVNIVGTSWAYRDPEEEEEERDGTSGAQVKSSYKLETYSSRDSSQDNENYPPSLYEKAVYEEKLKKLYGVGRNQNTDKDIKRLFDKLLF